MDRKHALIVGVSAYEALPKLPSCETDAADVYLALLSVGFAAEDMELLVENPGRLSELDEPPPIKSPTIGYIKDGLISLRDRAAPDDPVVVFFSGHGINAGMDYLCPPGTRTDDLTGSAISLDFVLAQLERCPSRKIHIFMDACRNELVQIASKGGTGDVRGLGGSHLKDQLTKREDLAALFSCQPGEKSYVIPDGDTGRGAFTSVIVDAIRDPELVTLRQLAEYANTNVDARNRQYGDDRHQRPLLLDSKTHLADLSLYGDPRTPERAVVELGKRIDALIPPLTLKDVTMIMDFAQNHWKQTGGIRSVQKELIEDLCNKSQEELSPEVLAEFRRMFAFYEAIIHPSQPAPGPARRSEGVES